MEGPGGGRAGGRAPARAGGAGAAGRLASARWYPFGILLHLNPPALQGTLFHDRMAPEVLAKVGSGWGGDGGLPEQLLNQAASTQFPPPPPPHHTHTHTFCTPLMPGPPRAGGVGGGVPAAASRGRGPRAPLVSSGGSWRELGRETEKERQRETHRERPGVAVYALLQQSLQHVGPLAVWDSCIVRQSCSALCLRRGATV